VLPSPKTCPPPLFFFRGSPDRAPGASQDQSGGTRSRMPVTRHESGPSIDGITRLQGNRLRREDGFLSLGLRALARMELGLQ
jgi:hypothetical protein